MHSDHSDTQDRSHQPDTCFSLTMQERALHWPCVEAHVRGMHRSVLLTHVQSALRTPSPLGRSGLPSSPHPPAQALQTQYAPDAEAAQHCWEPARQHLTDQPVPVHLLQSGGDTSRATLVQGQGGGHADVHETEEVSLPGLLGLAIIVYLACQYGTVCKSTRHNQHMCASTGSLAYARHSWEPMPASQQSNEAAKCRLLYIAKHQRFPKYTVEDGATRE